MKLTNINPDSMCIFAVVDSKGKRKFGLERSFMQERVINFTDTIVECEGVFYELYVEPKLMDAFMQHEDIKCIVSFQNFVGKVHIAVAREWRPRTKRAYRQHKQHSPKVGA